MADPMSLLFGDVLAVSWTEVATTWTGSIIGLGLLAFFWRPLLALTVSVDLASSSGIRNLPHQLLLTVILATVIATAMKVVGVLLITALLIIPAAAARFFSSSPERMAVVAALVGIGSVIIGLLGSLELDTPTGPSMVVAAGMAFVVGASARGLRNHLST